MNTLQILQSLITEEEMRKALKSLESFNNAAISAIPGVALTESKGGFIWKSRDMQSKVFLTKISAVQALADGKVVMSDSERFR